MKRFSALFIAVIMLLCVTAPLLAFAFDASAAASDIPAQTAAPTTNGDNVNITVMIPQPETTPVQPTPDPLPAPTPKPNPNFPELYPSDVYEFYDETSRQIIKTYELAASENPAGISRDNFERDGWMYELTDITKKENAHASTREQTETTTIETATKEMDDIIKLLAPTMEYKSDDGYIGVLTLDISSISVQTAGTKKSSYTMTATREYPHLSSNDTSLVPKTITQNGVSYTLDSVAWNTQSSAAVDYDQIPTSYTAVAKYTASGSKTTVTGYTTTASYTGTISKILTGRTVYTAYFMGKKITPLSPESTQPTAAPEQETAPTATPEPSTPPVADSDDNNTTPAPTPEPTPEPAPQPENPSNPWPIILCVFALAAVGGGGYYFLRKNKKVKEPVNDEEIV